MKHFFLLFAPFFLIISCTDDGGENQVLNSSYIQGSWSLVSVSGGFMPTTVLNPSWITYIFGQNLTVINNSPITTAQILGLEMGSYTYLLSDISVACNANNAKGIFIAGYNAQLCVKVNGNLMEIDSNVAADGLLYKFVRKECTTPVQCGTNLHAVVENAIVPFNASVNQSITIQLAYTVINSCGTLGYISETNIGNTKTLKVFAGYPDINNCYQALNTIYSNYTFTPTTIGTQIIKIEQPNGSFITYSIIIQ